MRWMGVTLALGGLVACSDSGLGGERFFAVMSGQNEVPPITGTSAGTATITASGGTLDYAVTVQSIVGVTRAAIFRGAGGATGTATAELYASAPTGVIASATIASGTLSAADITGITMDSLIALMRGGNAYVQVYTQSLPNGEIRGQIHAN